VRALVVVLALAVAAGACGYKSSPIAPELVRPTSPPNLRAKSTPAGIALTWKRPTRYSGGRRMRDLGGFEISRARGDALEFTQVERMQLDDQMRFRPEDEFGWTDRDVVAGERYRYRVVSFTLDGYRSKAATVQKRWNPKGARDDEDEAAAKDRAPTEAPADDGAPDDAVDTPATGGGERP
jgi:hypothetical protein